MFFKNIHIIYLFLTRNKLLSGKKVIFLSGEAHLSTSSSESTFSILTQLVSFHCEYIPRRFCFSSFSLCTQQTAVPSAGGTFDIDWEWRGSASRCLSLCFRTNSILDLVMANFRAWLIAVPVFVSFITRCHYSEDMLVNIRVYSERTCFSVHSL